MSDEWVNRIVADVAAQPDRFRALKRFLVMSLSMYTGMKRQMLKEMDAPKLVYSCPEELVLFNATAKEVFITNCQFPPMRVGNCFANAFELSLRHPELRYVEGWACMEQSYPTHHAWVEHPDGSISDPTWLTLIEGYLQDDKTKLIPDYAGRCVYMGVSVWQPHHLGWFIEHETPNLLAFGEMTPREVLEVGIGAFGMYPLTRRSFDDAKETVLEILSKTKPWELSDCGTHYIRENDDGSITRWFKEGDQRNGITKRCNPLHISS